MRNFQESPSLQHPAVNPLSAVARESRWHHRFAYGIGAFGTWVMAEEFIQNNSGEVLPTAALVAATFAIARMMQRENRRFNPSS